MTNTELNELADAIDSASDEHDTKKLETILGTLDSLIDGECSENRSILHFFKANCFAALRIIERNSVDDTWSWHQERLISELLHLRKAVAERGFVQLNTLMQCKILTNIANGLGTIGRVAESLAYYNQVLSLSSNFAMAIGNKGIGLFHYGQHLYDYGHRGILFFHANKELRRFGAEPLLWDSGVDQKANKAFSAYRAHTDEILEAIKYDKSFDFEAFPLGDTEEERNYKEWCLKNKLFLNPLNDVFSSKVAASDVLHLPSHVYSMGEQPRFPKYYNVLKQEFIFARHMLYEFTSNDDKHYSDNDVLLENSFDGVHFGYRNELLKNSLRTSYSLFDKIALFLNDYMDLGLKVDGVNFRNVWGKFDNKKKRLQIYERFLTSENWLLRGLYFLSKDLYAPSFIDVAEPDARELHLIRKMAEHRYLGIQEYAASEEDTEYLKYTTVDDLEGKALKMLRLSREALIYLSLAMHVEELKREDQREEGLVVPIQSTKL
tara:strand:+ start:2221 stop:3696 length:1476 start_codon:yes stop_codon:yes gene_type:complete